MGASLSFQARSPGLIDPIALCEGAATVLRILLNQPAEFLPSFAIVDAHAAPCTTPFMSGDGIHTAIEDRYFRDGLLFLYHPRKYWQEFGDRPTYSFYIDKVCGNVEDHKLAMSLAVLITAARILSEDHIHDSDGILFGSLDEDKVHIDSVLGLALKDPLPLDEAPRAFNKQFRWFGGSPRLT